METLLRLPFKEEDNSRILNSQYGDEVVTFIQSEVDLNYERVEYLDSSNLWDIEFLRKSDLENLINGEIINNFRYINKYFELANNKIELGGKFIGRYECKNQRKERIYKFHLPLVNCIIYTIDFIWKRIIPKLSVINKLYFSITKGEDRVLTTSEVNGRLMSCGFKILQEKQIEGYTYFIAQKVDAPKYDMDPTYGPFVKLDRIGKGGNIIKVYKVRTMHPYSEYLQDYIYQKNDLQKGGKFKDDTRVTSWGKVFRKFWIDELPMLLNLFKGELKLVGVRPLSRQYFNLYPYSFQQRRIKYRPGLVPPFYVDIPESLDEIISSEKKYLDSYDRHPILTDIKYFCKSLFNIIFKRARSR